MRTAVFVVQPGGLRFVTSDLRTGGDTSDAFCRAHRAAAKQADQGIESWVLDIENGERSGFGPTAAFTPSTVLYRINQLGLCAVWNGQDRSWVPLAERRLSEEVMRRYIKLYGLDG